MESVKFAKVLENKASLVLSKLLMKTTLKGIIMLKYALYKCENKLYDANDRNTTIFVSLILILSIRFYRMIVLMLSKGLHDWNNYFLIVSIEPHNTLWLINLKMIVQCDLYLVPIFYGLIDPFYALIFNMLLAISVIQ